MRAIAVLSVLFFHFGVDLFSGGFVGVDVFFVISGFLITRLIKDGVENGTFSFGKFYIRRARRLFPALFFTVLATFLVACTLFTPDNLERVGGATLHVLLSVSNFFFWAESGYFDANSTVKPLLHFWSLSVEEQFYFVWPFIMVFLLTRFTSKFVLPIFILVTGGASLLFAQKWLSVDSAAVFFLLPFRVMEFAFGAIVVWLLDFKPKSNLLRELILALGLILIIYSVIAFNDETLFPGLSAVVPCLGTAMAIFAGKPKLLGGFLANKALVFIGLISYSLYLCHWPIYVFYRYAAPDIEITYFQVAVLTAVSLLVATLMYRFVERPFRFVPIQQQTQGTSAVFGLICALLCLVMVLPAAHAWANKGWAWRYSGGGEDMSQLFDLDQFRFESIQFNQENVLAATFSSGRRKVLVVGDSHARDVSNGLVQVLPSNKFEVRMENLDDACLKYLEPNGAIQKDMRGDKAEYCNTRLQKYFLSVKVKQADVIVLSSYFDVPSAKLVDRLIKLTNRLSRKKNVKFIVMDRSITFWEFHPQAIRMMSEGANIEKVNRSTFKFAKEPVISKVHSTLEKNVGGIQNVSLVAKKPLLCGEDSCSFFLQDGTLAIWDSTHWTLPGAKTFIGQLLKNEPDLFD